MSNLPSLPEETRRLLALRRRDRAAARAALAALTEEQQLALICDSPVDRRAELLDLVSNPERLIPALPPAELVFTVKAIGLESSSWILEYATPEQVTAAFDLDAWRGHDVDRARLDAWLDALAEIEDDALTRDLEALDNELLVDWLCQRIAVVQKPDDDPGWQPPDGSQTLEGQFHFVALREDDDLAGVLRALHLLFVRDYWSYFRLLQGVIHETPTENIEWALRWRTGRLQDLGFPAWEEAIALYRYLPPEDRALVPRGAPPLDVEEWHLPVAMPSLPVDAGAHHPIFRAIAELGPEERRSAFYAFVAVANKIAVADAMDLADVETTPRAIEKAAIWTSRGLEHVAKENGLGFQETLHRVSLERLYRVGASLEPDAARPPGMARVGDDDGEDAD